MRKLFPFVFIAIQVAGYSDRPEVPTNLLEYEHEYLENPQVANLGWFKDAG